LGGPGSDVVFEGVGVGVVGGTDGVTSLVAGGVTEGTVGGAVVAGGVLGCKSGAAVVDAGAVTVSVGIGVLLLEASEPHADKVTTIPASAIESVGFGRKTRGMRGMHASCHGL